MPIILSHLHLSVTRAQRADTGRRYVLLWWWLSSACCRPCSASSPIPGPARRRHLAIPPAADWRRGHGVPRARRLRYNQDNRQIYDCSIGMDVLSVRDTEATRKPA